VRFEPAAVVGATDSVLVVTWNVHVGGGDVPALIEEVRAGALSDGTPPAAFVILLQEAYRSGPDALRPGPDFDGQTLHHTPPSGRRSDIVEVAEALRLHLAYAPAEPNGRPFSDAPDEDRGVAILSSHPLRGVRVLELPRERQRRVALVATMAGMRPDGTPWELRVATAHLENRAPWSRLFDSFGPARGRQAEALVRELGDGPVVLGADLNTWAPDFVEPALSVMARTFPDSPRATGSTYSVLGVGRTLDHLLFRLGPAQRAHVAVADDRYGSDHSPVVGMVGLGRTTDVVIDGTR
jgi:endonuclease/exonuclease/phosphatase family metal-dependent hydrolase